MKPFLVMLKDEGVDVAGTMDRLSDDEGFYKSLLASFFASDPLKELKEAVAIHDYEAGLRAAHSLKGVTLNLGLSPLADPCIEMLQHYRANEGEIAESLLPKASEAFDDFEKKIKPYLESVSK